MLYPVFAGERAVRVMGNIFAIAQLDMQQKKLRLPNGSVVVMTPCAVHAGATILMASGL